MEKQNEVTDRTDFRQGGLECVGGPISFEKVKTWTNNYRRINDRDITTSHFFGREVIEKILRQPGCAGVRIHYAVDEHNQKQLILSGVNRVGKDQLPQSARIVGMTNDTHAKKADNHSSQQAENTESNNLPHAEMFETTGNDETGELYDQSWPCPQTQGCPGAI